MPTSDSRRVSTFRDSVALWVITLMATVLARHDPDTARPPHLDGVKLAELQLLCVWESLSFMRRSGLQNCQRLATQKRARQVKAKFVGILSNEMKCMSWRAVEGITFVNSAKGACADELADLQAGKIGQAAALARKG